MDYITLPNGVCLNCNDIIAVSPIIDPIQDMIDSDDTGFDFECYDDKHYYQFKVFIKNSNCQEVEFTDYDKALELRNYILDNISSEESDLRKAHLLYIVFLFGRDYQIRDIEFAHETPYEFIKRKAKKLGRANDFFDNPQFIKVFNK